MINTWKSFSKYGGVAMMNLEQGKVPMNIRRKVLLIRSIMEWHSNAYQCTQCLGRVSVKVGKRLNYIFE